MASERFEMVHGKRYERKVMAKCTPRIFEVNSGDTVTIVSFHAPQHGLPKRVAHWQHAVWYAYYVATRPWERIPNMIYNNKDGSLH